MKKILLLLFLFSKGLFVFGQFDTARITVIGGVHSDECREVVELRNGGYIAVGTTASFGQGNTDIYLVKTDTGGICQWSETIGQSGIDRGYSVKETFDGGLIIAGYTNDYGAFGYDFFLAKTDSTGLLLWTKTYGGSDWDFGYSVQQTSDSGFVICGESYSYSNGDADVLVVKTDLNGNLTWIKNVGGALADAGYSIIIDRTGNYVVAGKTFSYGNGNSDAYVISLNTFGDTLWTKTFGFSATESAFGIDTTSDGGFVICGVSNSFGSGNNNGYFVKLNSFGNQQWYQTYGGSGNCTANKILQCPDGGYIVAGTDNSFGAGGYGFSILRTDGGGFQEHAPTFGGPFDEQGFSVALSANGSVMFGGTTRSYGHGEEDVYLLKLPSDSVVQDYTLDIRLCSDTPVVAGINNYFSINFQTTVFPNPFNDWTEIKLADSWNKNHSYNFEVYNCLGQAVYSIRNITSNKFRFYRSNLRSGLYCFLVRENGIQVAKGKFLID